ncbi:hypothetical protein CEH05_04465 [Halobacillus halophilus]|nr:hypothetical protein CEH05_04465 [Halobacillus halophilus]
MATSIDPTSCRAAGKRVVSVAALIYYLQRAPTISKLSIPVSGAFLKGNNLAILNKTFFYKKWIVR